jgi:putative copper export protein
VGGILFFLSVFGPAVHALPAASGIQALDKGRRRFQSLSWIAIHLALFTGIVNFVLRGIAAGWAFDPAYNWTLAAKFFLFLAMLFHHSLQAWKYAPRLAALTAQTTPDFQSWPEPLLFHWKKWFVLLKINATLGLIALLLGLALSRS